MKLGWVKKLLTGDDCKICQVNVLKGSDWNKEPPNIEVHSINHLYPMELSLTHNHMVENNEDHAELITEPIDDLGMEQES